MSLQKKEKELLLIQNMINMMPKFYIIFSILTILNEKKQN